MYPKGHTVLICSCSLEFDALCNIGEKALIAEVQGVEGQSLLLVNTSKNDKHIIVSMGRFSQLLNLEEEGVYTVTTHLK